MNGLKVFSMVMLAAVIAVGCGDSSSSTSTDASSSGDVSVTPPTPDAQVGVDAPGSQDAPGSEDAGPGVDATIVPDAQADVEPDTTVSPDAGPPVDSGPSGPCSPSPCENGATCESQGDQFVCICGTGWTGELCTENIDECLDEPCQNGGGCTDEAPGYTCSCLNGWLGEHCDEDVDECALGAECPEGSTCQNKPGSFECVCDPGTVSAGNDCVELSGCSPFSVLAEDFEGQGFEDWTVYDTDPSDSVSWHVTSNGKLRYSNPSATNYGGETIAAVLSPPLQVPADGWLEMEVALDLGDPWSASWSTDGWGFNGYDLFYGVLTRCEDDQDEEGCLKSAVCHTLYPMQALLEGAGVAAAYDCLEETDDHSVWLPANIAWSGIDALRHGQWSKLQYNAAISAGQISQGESTVGRIFSYEYVSEDEIYPWIDESWSPPWWEQPEWIADGAEPPPKQMEFGDEPVRLLLVFSSGDSTFNSGEGVTLDNLRIGVPLDGTECASCDTPGASLPTCVTCQKGFAPEGACDTCSNPNKALPDCVSCLPKFTGVYCDECADPAFQGDQCDECVNEEHTGPQCGECVNGGLWPACDQCELPGYALSSGCTECSPKHTGPDCGECSNPNTKLPTCFFCKDGFMPDGPCDECSDPKFTGADCTECTEKFTGPGCAQCVDPTLTGAYCTECSDPAFDYSEETEACDICASPYFAEPDCATCLTGFTGEGCLACVEGVGPEPNEDCLEPGADLSQSICAPSYYCDECLEGPLLQAPACDVCQAQYTGESCEKKNLQWMAARSGHIGMPDGSIQPFHSNFLNFYSSKGELFMDPQENPLVAFSTNSYLKNSVGISVGLRADGTITADMGSTTASDVYSEGWTEKDFEAWFNPQGSYIEIAVGPMHDRYYAIEESGGGVVEIGEDHTAALPGEQAPYHGLAVGGYYGSGSQLVCALDQEDAIVCEDTSDDCNFIDTDYPCEPPEGAFTQVVVGGMEFGTTFGCARDEDGFVQCWGALAPELTPPTDVAYGHLVADGTVLCGARLDGGIDCWGSWYLKGSSYFGADLAADFDWPVTELRLTINKCGSYALCGKADSGSWSCNSPDVPGESCEPNPKLGACTSETFAGPECDMCANPFKVAPSCESCSGPLAAEDCGSFLYTRLSVGAGFDKPSICGVRTDSRVLCNFWPQPLSGEGYLDVAVRNDKRICALTTAGELQCLGKHFEASGDVLENPEDLPQGPFEELWYRGGLFCALNADHEATCWSLDSQGFGADYDYKLDVIPPPPYEFVDIVPILENSGPNAYYQPCGLTVDGEVQCWGSAPCEADPSSADCYRAGPYIALTHKAALRPDGSMDYWGAGNPLWPDVGYKAISGGDTEKARCVIDSEDLLQCDFVLDDVPAEKVKAIHVAYEQVCFIRDDDSVGCFDEDGKVNTVLPKPTDDNYWYLP